MTKSAPGTAIFPAGAWLPAPAGGAVAEPAPTLLLTQPREILVAHSAEEVPGIIEQTEAAQKSGCYVAGYLAYEAGAAFGLATQTTRSRPPGGALAPDSLPLAWMAVYEPDTAQELTPDRAAGPALGAAAPLPRDLTLNESLKEYSAAIARVREYIAAGDTYQVNYTVRARFDLGIDPQDYLLARATAHPVPYAAYLDLGGFQVISLSPELFLRRRGSRLESHPMKGTRPRGATRTEDAALGYELVRSVKDRAENVMICDMLRNDLGRVCRTGSIRVPALFALEPYGTVWQMISTVIGDMKSGTTLLDTLAATFPGSSVTGAPKVRTMEIIREMESQPRGVYCGTVGLFLPGGDFTCNLCIRTIAHDRGHCLLGVGSGVVWDSDAGEEYEETWTKAAFVFRDDSREEAVPFAAEVAVGAEAGTGVGLFETLLLNAGTACSDSAAPRALVLLRYHQLEQHLERMVASAVALGIPFDTQKARRLLEDTAPATRDATVVRLDLAPSGELSVRARPVPAAPQEPVKVLLSPFRTDPNDALLRHKTTDRPLYDQEHQRAVELGLFDAVFLNGRDQVTEGAITNLFARFGSQWVTPPVVGGLLPGIWRAKFIRDMGAIERSLTLEELAAADAVLLGNSVRGAVRVGELIERPW